MLIPMRAGHEALIVSWDLEEIVATLPNPNVELEKIWAGLLVVVRDSWPDLPVEVWTHVAERDGVDEIDVDALPAEDDASGDAPAPSPYRLQFAVFFGGEDRTSKTAAAMASFMLAGLARAVPVEPAAEWGPISPAWKPLWAIDDANVLRLFAPEATLERSVYLLGSYAGRPTWFAASEEAWPLQRARAAIGIDLADADVSWAFDL